MKEPQRTQEQGHMEIIPTIEKKVSNIQHLEIESHTELVKEEFKITKPKVGTKPLIV